MKREGERGEFCAVVIFPKGKALRQSMQTTVLSKEGSM